jgi:hypothetical protein
MSSLQPKTLSHANKYKSVSYSQRKTKLIETVPEEGQTLDLLDKDSKVNCINYVQRIKGN